MKESHKGLHGALLEEGLHVVVVSGSDVRQTPGRLELQFRHVIATQEGKKARDQVSVNHALDGRRVLKGQQPAEPNGGKLQEQVVLAVHQLEQTVEVSDLHGERER